MRRVSGKNTGLTRKRAGLAPEIASIPRAFGYPVSSMRTAAAALQRYFQILELKWVLARGIGPLNKRGHLYFRFLSRACAISR